MRRICCLAIAFCLATLSPALALVCTACGVPLPEHSRFCLSCGAAQPGTPATPPPPAAVPAARRPGTAAPAGQASQGGVLSPQRFAAIVKPLEAHEPELRLSQLGNPRVLPLIQQILLPGCQTIDRNLARHGLTLTPAQAKLLALYKERYATIVAWGTSLGSERDFIFPKIGQLLAQQVYLQAFPDDATVEAVEAIGGVFARERANLVARIDDLNEKAGFENPGVAYQVCLPGQPPTGDSFRFSLLMGSTGKRVGDRMQVFDHEGTRLGSLQFTAQKDGIRRYTGTMSRARLAAMASRQVWVEYVTKSTLSTSWNKERLRLFLLLCLPTADPAAFEFEAFHGTAPEVSRMRFLRSIGKY
ncbi:MAG: zinc ribbon domain-containing protein [Candidatus Riflebacteria bacterium]|nr:zinc ribbon domain-containing protein [Candidatus Riflebacteria bacterium]